MLCTRRMADFMADEGAEVKTEYLNDWPHTPAASYFFSQVALQMVRDTNKATLIEDVTDDVINVLDSLFHGVSKLLR